MIHGPSSSSARPASPGSRSGRRRSRRGWWANVDGRSQRPARSKAQAPRASRSAPRGGPRASRLAVGLASRTSRGAPRAVGGGRLARWASRGGRRDAMATGGCDGDGRGDGRRAWRPGRLMAERTQRWGRRGGGWLAAAKSSTGVEEILYTRRRRPRNGPLDHNHPQRRPKRQRAAEWCQTTSPWLSAGGPRALGRCQSPGEASQTLAGPPIAGPPDRPDHRRDHRSSTEGVGPPARRAAGPSGRRAVGPSGRRAAELDVRAVVQREPDPGPPDRLPTRRAVSRETELVARRHDRKPWRSEWLAKRSRLLAPGAQRRCRDSVSRPRPIRSVRASGPRGVHGSRSVWAGARKRAMSSPSTCAK